MYENTDININLKQVYTGLPYKTQSKYVMIRHRSHSTLCLLFLPEGLYLPIAIKVLKLDYNNHMLYDAILILLPLKKIKKKKNSNIVS